MRQNSRFHFIILLVLLSAFGFSQSKKPLKAILSVIEKQHDVKFNFIENEIAEFELIPPNSILPLSEKIHYLEKETPLLFEMITPTYITISKRKTENPDVIHDKSQLPIDLTEVKIDNYLTTGISKKPDGMYTISPKKMGLLPGLSETDLLQTIQQIPGIYSSDETISNINIRGGTHDQNMFLWNGIRMFQTGHFFGLISAFNPNLNDKITISKNGTSAFYGESVSGIVTISSDLDNQEKYNSGVSSNLISTEFHSKIQLNDNAKFQISGRRSLTDFFQSATYKKYYNRIFQHTVVTDLESDSVIPKTEERFYFYDFSVQYDQKIGLKNELKVALIGINNSLELSQIDNSNPEKTIKNSGLTQRNLGGTITWKTNWDPENTTQIELYASDYNLDADHESVGSTQVLKQRNHVLDTGLRLENHHQLSENFAFNNGYQYNETGIRNNDEINLPVFTRKIKDVLHSHALILETEWHSKNNGLGLKTGIRTNYFEEFNRFIVEPRIRFQYAFSKKWQLALLGEQKNQTATQIVDLQQDFLGVEKRRWLLANNDSNPIQKSNQIEIGLLFKSKNWLLTFDNYYKKISGISSRSQSFQNQLEFEKINGNITVLGSEVLLQRNFKHYYTWISYCWNDNNYIFDTYVPKHFANNFEISQSISAAAIYDHKNLKLALGAKWLSGKPETTPRNETMNSDAIIEYNNPNNTNLQPYFQTNFSASYIWQMQKCELTGSISILNLLNDRNTINRYYRSNAQNEIERVDTYSLERTPNLSLKFQF